MPAKAIATNEALRIAAGLPEESREKFLTPDDAAGFLSVHRNTLDGWHRKGGSAPPRIMLFGRWYYQLTGLKEFLRQTVEAS